MFATRRVLFLPLPQCPRVSVRTGPSLTRRPFSVQALSEGFLDLAIALPLPPSLPPYSTTIILITVVSRLVFTLPFSVWAQKRRWRLDDIVRPTIEAMVPKISENVITEMKKNGEFRVAKKEYESKAGRIALNAKFKEVVTERTRKLIDARQKQLLRQYNCSPRATFLLPIMSQLPLFVGTSMVLSHLSQTPTPFDSESFLTLNNLSNVDPTTALPIVLGFFTLANVESSGWFMTEAQLERKALADAKYIKKVEEGGSPLELNRVIKTGLRVASVGRVIIAAMVPGGVVLYWVTSAAFGLLQTWVLDYWGLRNRNRRLAALSMPTTQTISSPPLRK